MPRTPDTVWLLEGTLEAETAFSVGGLAADALADLPLACDGLGRFLVPGTSLAGALRQRSRDLLAVGSAALGLRADDVDALFGRGPSSRQPTTGSGSGPRSKADARDGGDDGHASLLEVDDALVEGAPSAPELRESTSIDAEWGSAAHAVLFSREVLPVGCRLALSLRVETASASQAGGAALRLLPALAQSLARHGLVLGAASSRGLGRFQIQPSSLRLLRLNLRNHVHLQYWWLRRAGCAGREPEGIEQAIRVADVAARGVERPPAPGHVRFWVQWRPRGPLVVTVGVEGLDADRIPLQTSRAQAKGPRTWHAVLPGASIKGALRSHAERIVRTCLAGAPGTGPADDREVPLQQRRLRQLERSPESTQVAFGRARTKQQGVRLRSAISVADVHHRTPCQGPALLWEADHKRRAQAWPGYRRVTRNAVDRWTGGAKDTALFTVLVPEEAPDAAPGTSTWEPLCIDVDVRHLDAEQRGATLSLLWFVLVDMAEGQVPLGYGTRRGFGDVEVTGVSVWDGDDRLPDLTVDGARRLLPEADEAGRWAGVLEDWARGWRAATGAAGTGGA